MISSEEVESLRKQMYELQLEVDILKETINVLKKDPGVDWKNLKNREKVAVIDAMKEKYPLPILLRRVELSRSSYYYQIKAFAAEDKYKYLRHEVVRIFLEKQVRYGYRRIHAELKKKRTSKCRSRQWHARRYDCEHRRKIQTDHSYGSRMPLSLAGLDRENGDKRI